MLLKRLVSISNNKNVKFYSFFYFDFNLFWILKIYIYKKWKRSYNATVQALPKTLNENARKRELIRISGDN